MTRDTRMLVVSAAGLMVAAAAAGAILFSAALAAGQGAAPVVASSQPDPAQIVHVSMSWTQWAGMAVLLSAVLSTLATSLTNRVPKATGVVTWLLVVCDVLSFWGNKNSPTTLNIPGRRSALSCDEVVAVTQPGYKGVTPGAHDTVIVVPVADASSGLFNEPPKKG